MDLFIRHVYYCYTGLMKILKAPTQLLYQVMELYTPKTQEQRQNRKFVATVIVLLAALALFYNYLS